MAIKKSDIARFVAEDIEGALRSHEEAIDNFLRIKGAEQGMTGYAIYDTKGMRTAIIRGLLDRYQNAGWRVEFHADQRDGSYLQFWFD